ncbi:hypothetical protein SGLAM104S_06849 [Streptomyces glaucescens]
MGLSYVACPCHVPVRSQHITFRTDSVTVRFELTESGTLTSGRAAASDEADRLLRAYADLGEPGAQGRRSPYSMRLRTFGGELGRALAA